MASGSKTKKSNKRSSKTMKTCSPESAEVTLQGGMPITHVDHSLQLVGQLLHALGLELSSSMWTVDRERLIRARQRGWMLSHDLRAIQRYRNLLWSQAATDSTSTGSSTKTSTRKRGAATPKD